MGGFCGVVSKDDCITDLFFGTDYHSHLGTRRGGLATYDADSGRFTRFIHNIENAQFRTKFETTSAVSPAAMGIGVISDNEDQPARRAVAPGYLRDRHRGTHRERRRRSPTTSPARGRRTSPRWAAGRSTPRSSSPR